MKCPACGNMNIQGTDECDSCFQDLRSIDGIIPRTKIEKVLINDPVWKLMPQREPVVVSKTDKVYAAVVKMNEAKVGCVLVVGPVGLEGIMTERDVVLKAIALEKDLSKITVESIMTPNPDSLTVEDTLVYAVNRMSVGGFRHIPILKDGKPVGIVSIRDVLKYLSKLFP